MNFAVRRQLDCTAAAIKCTVTEFFEGARHPGCRHLIYELALYSYRTQPKTGVILLELEDRENHPSTPCATPLRGCGGAAMTAQ